MTQKPVVTMTPSDYIDMTNRFKLQTSGESQRQKDELLFINSILNENTANTANTNNTQDINLDVLISKIKKEIDLPAEDIIKLDGKIEKLKSEKTR
jgi:hypothetical protein